MVKILSYEIRNNKIRVMTDNDGRPEFVYQKHRFVTKAALLQEIKKSIAQEKKVKDKQKVNLDKLEAELNAHP